MAMVRSTDEQERYLRYLFLFPEHTFMVFAIIRILDLEPSLLVLVANSHLCSTFPIHNAIPIVLIQMRFLQGAQRKTLHCQYIIARSFRGMH